MWELWQTQISRFLSYWALEEFQNLLPEDKPRNGGIDQACRGASVNDNSASYYTVAQPSHCYALL